MTGPCPGARWMRAVTSTSSPRGQDPRLLGDAGAGDQAVVRAGAGDPARTLLVGDRERPRRAAGPRPPSRVVPSSAAARSLTSRTMPSSSAITTPSGRASTRVTGVDDHVGRDVVDGRLGSGGTRGSLVRRRTSVEQHWWGSAASEREEMLWAAPPPGGAAPTTWVDSPSPAGPVRLFASRESRTRSKIVAVSTLHN